MQDDLTFWVDMGKFLFDGEYDKIDYNKCEQTVDTLLMRLAYAETKVRTRLSKLSGEE